MYLKPEVILPDNNSQYLFIKNALDMKKMVTCLESPEHKIYPREKKNRIY